MSAAAATAPEAAAPAKPKSREWPKRQWESDMLERKLLNCTVALAALHAATVFALPG